MSESLLIPQAAGAWLRRNSAARLLDAPVCIYGLLLGFLLKRRK